MHDYWKRLRRNWLMRRADIHIVSFPKCGRTWLVLMLSKVIELHYGVSIDNPLKLRRYTRKCRDLPLILQHHDGGPEFQRAEEVETDKSFYRGSKVVFLVRDPRDVTVSAYFQKTKRNINFHGTIREYVYEPVGSIETNIAFYNIWAENRGIPDDFLLLTYENLHADATRELERLVRFVGIKGVSTETLQTAVDACTFENMRRLESTNALGSGRLAPRDVDDQSTYKTREGRIGGYVDHLEPPEIAHVDRLIGARLHDDYAFYKL
ncbi:sulfotransferase domain-containing protein [Aquisalimonas sp.]|uniref:sulfotransferase domain-containing protein n=1 Tax=Aquisalimonas sp. TaxID=1872621 RepID=UPI0025C48D2A|nr:sulfotransferase domain-containing protein [Aquisalimonas sp.]